MKENESSKKSVTKPPRVKKPKKANSEYYVDPAVFETQICDYYKSGVMGEDLAMNVRRIAEGLSYASNFINYSYKEDMVGDALENMLKALTNRKFTPGAGYNPFSYFTTIAFHAFINRIKREKKHRETIMNYQELIYNEMVCNGEIVPQHITHDSDEDE